VPAEPVGIHEGEEVKMAPKERLARIDRAQQSDEKLAVAAAFAPVEPHAEAMQALFERHAAKVFRLCARELGSPEEAEDAVQITFLNALRGLRRGVVPEFESAWLLKIALNVCRQERRSRMRRLRVETPRDMLALQHVAAVPERSDEDLPRIEDALARMNTRHRHALVLREWKGLSYDEIAATLGLSRPAVETLLFRARRSLARRLEFDEEHALPHVQEVPRSPAHTRPTSPSAPLLRAGAQRTK
jgi:RNA polymerase sigma-70 factor, ECF subfamily